MEVAQIISTLREKVGTTSLSDRTFQEYVNAVNPQVEPDDAFWAQHTAILKSMSGQFSHDVADWQKKYQQEHPIQQQQQQQEPPAISPEVQALIDAQKKSIEDLKAMVTGQQQRMSQEAIRAAASQQGEALKVTNRNLWNDAVTRINITEGMTSEQFNAQVKTIYEQNLKSFVGDGVQPYGNAAPPDTSAQTKAELDAFFANKPGFESK